MNWRRYDGKDETRKAIVRNKLEADDAAVAVYGNRLREALGHPESKFGVAADLLESADTALFEGSGGAVGEVQGGDSGR